MSATRQITETQQQTQEELVLRLTTEPSASTSTSSRPNVTWTTETVDNEHLGKKKSKCCCIYKKPKNWQDSSSDEDSDCETGHCRGHVEQKKKQDEPCPHSKP